MRTLLARDPGFAQLIESGTPQNPQNTKASSRSWKLRWYQLELIDDSTRPW
jgi:hypothetical protein